MRIVERLTDDESLSAPPQAFQPFLPPLGPENRSAKLLLTPDEAAAALSISRSLLYQLLSCKRVFSVKVGSARRIPMCALTEYVASLCDQEKAG